MQDEGDPIGNGGGPLQVPGAWTALLKPWPGLVPALARECGALETTRAGALDSRVESGRPRRARPLSGFWIQQ
jgi:hypothetical protein